MNPKYGNLRFFLITGLVIGAISLLAGFDKPFSSGYNFSIPEQRNILPDTLREISGIALLDEQTLACIQDENGILFIYDLAAGSISRQYPFHLDGDYEGIARVGKELYILRSDGVLFRIRDYDTTPVLDSMVTGIPVTNNEGLCYDSHNHRLLIACKNKAKNHSKGINERFVYAFDPETHTCSAEPVFTFEVRSLREYAKKNGIPFPKKQKKSLQENPSEEPKIRFRPSEIGIHPLTGQLFLLSATDHALFIFSGSGNLQYIELLDASLFNKSEGIAFLQNGDLLISNEGQNKQATILRFSYVP